MFYVQPTGLVGFTPGEITLQLVNRVGSTQSYGKVVMLDLAASAAEITSSSADSYVPGKEGSVWDNFVAPTALGVKSGFLGVVTERGGIADNARGKVTFYGLVEALAVSTGQLFKPFLTQFTARTTGDLDGKSTILTNDRIVAFYNAPQSSSSSTTKLKTVLFNGITGVSGRPSQVIP